MGSKLSTCKWKNSNSISMSLLKDDAINDITSQLDDFSNKQFNILQQQDTIARKQNTIAKQQSSIAKQQDIIIKHQKNHLQKIKTLEKILEDSVKEFNSKIKLMENKKSLYKILNNIHNDSIEYYCNRHQSKNSISWLPDNVEKNIYLNCLTFLKEIVKQDENLLESSVYDDNEIFYSIKDSRTGIIWNDNNDIESTQNTDTTENKQDNSNDTN